MLKILQGSKYATMIYIHFNTTLSKYKLCWVLGPHAFNPSTNEAETGRSLWVGGQPGLQSKSEDGFQSYTEKTRLKKTIYM